MSVKIQIQKDEYLQLKEENAIYTMKKKAYEDELWELREENEKLKEENKELSKRNKDLNKGFDRFKAEMYDLKVENERLKELNSDLDYLVYQNGLELEAEKAIEQLRQQRDELVEMLVEILQNGVLSINGNYFVNKAEQLLREIKEERNELK